MRAWRTIASPAARLRAREGLRLTATKASTPATTTTTTTATATATAASTSTTTAAPPGDGPNHRSIMSLDGYSIRPYVQPDAFAAPSSSVIGSVVLNDKAAAMYGVTIRGDLALIHVGIYSVISDNAVITAGRVRDGLSPADAVAAGLPIEPECLVGDFCTVGANAHLHSCMLRGDNVVGEGAVIGEGVELGRYAEVSPRAVVAQGTVVGEGEVWAGNPAIKVGEVSADLRQQRRRDAFRRGTVTADHLWEFLPVGNVFWEKERLADK